ARAEYFQHFHSSRCRFDPAIRQDWQAKIHFSLWPGSSTIIFSRSRGRGGRGGGRSTIGIWSNGQYNVQPQPHCESDGSAKCGVADCKTVDALAAKATQIGA